MRKILLVDDEVKLLKIISSALEKKDIVSTLHLMVMKPEGHLMKRMRKLYFLI